ncbi:MAG: phosphatase PAP2 family protein [Bryobacteraceae bacterium]
MGTGFEFPRHKLPKNRCRRETEIRCLSPFFSGFRTSEWLLIVFFAYIALLIPWFPNRARLHLYPVVLLVCAFALIAVFAYGEKTRVFRAVSYVRDWLPLGLTLLAFREMELFMPRHFGAHLERIWIQWDDRLLAGWHMRAGIEALGKVMPFYLELCYLLVYAVAAYCVIVLYASKKRNLVDRFFVIYLTGTLLAYALFPYFPSQPPRIAFPASSAPHVTTWVRTLNLAILNAATIHVGVFPSAHVSSAFSAAWAMFLLLPRRKAVGWVFVFYALSVAVATVYGRYHYIADVAAGFAVSLAAAGVCLVFRARRAAPPAAPAATTEA